MRLSVLAAAAAVLLVGGLALFSQGGSSPESAQVTPPASALTKADVAVQPPPANESPAPGGRVDRMQRKSLQECVAEAEVIVVASALDFAPAPPNVPGDPPEDAVRFRVRRVLKGKLTEETITTRSPTPGKEFVGHDWVVMLSPEFVAGKHSYAGRYAIKMEPEVKAILAKDAK